MPPKLDPAILRALSLDGPANISAHGGSGFASTYRITSPDRSVFVKMSNAAGAAVMFEGEHASLNAIHNTVPSLCPKSFAWGKADNGGYFLATEFLDLGTGSSSTKSGTTERSGLSLAQKLAKLHTTTAPTPDGYDQPMFGFPVTTCCGETPQPNNFKPSWAEFFAENRLLAILERSEKNQGKDVSLRQLIEEVTTKVVPRLLGDGHLGGSKGITPVVTHGDLWSGNKGTGSFVGRNEGGSEKAVVEPVIFDPSVAYTHNEYEHGIQSMFGGFGQSFWKEYFELCPKTEPVEEYEDRVALYESYHHLNHYAMFGGGYKGGAVSLLKPLCKKYGGD